MIEYRKAVENDVNSLKKLWLKVFEDKEIAVELFFQRIFNADISYVAVDGEKIVSMLYLLPSLVNGHKACYLYAVATDESYRGQGIMGNLIEYALNNSDAELCVTLPATESLYDFYGKFGFEKLTSSFSHISREDVTALAKPYPLNDLFVSGYAGIRNRVLKDNFLFWNNNRIDYAFEYNKIYGAKVLKSNFGYAIAYEKDGICTVSEIIATKENVPNLLTDILTEFSSKEFYFHLSPNQKFFKSTPKTFGMVKYLTDYKPENIYCGLTLD